MKCTKDNCSKKNFCENIHNLNGDVLGANETIRIPNKFFVELNIGNRLVKRGIPSEGFEFGCMKLLSENGKGAFYINDKHIIDFTLEELVESSNNAFYEMIQNREIKIG